MFTTRKLIAAVFAVAALTLATSTATAQTGTKTAPAGVKNAVQVKSNVKLAASPAANAKNLQIPEAVKNAINAPDLTVTKITVGSGNVVSVTVKNVGRSATTQTIKMKIASSGTGNLDQPASLETVNVPVLAVGEEKTIEATKQHVEKARAEVNTQGVILLAANVDSSEQIAEPSEANNVKIISTK